MALQPIEDLKEIKSIVDVMKDFDPKKDSIADYLKDIGNKITEMNNILRKYFS